MRSRYQELLQSVYDAAVVSNVYGRITDINDRALQFFQYSREELCSMQIFDIVSGTDKQLLETLCEALNDQRFTLLQAHCRRHDGSLFPAEIAVNMLRFGQVYLCFFVRDITRRKRAEDRLRTEHEAIHNAAAGIVIADLNARIEYGNPAFAKSVGVTPSDRLVGQGLGGFLADPDTIVGDIADTLNAGGTWQADVELKRADGTSRVLACSATCSRNDEGDPVNLVFTFAPRDPDKTSLKIDALERELREVRDYIARLNQETPQSPPDKAAE